MLERSAGVLCHISSLSGKYGIGSLGKEAYAFARLLAQNGVKYWQILPLVQTGYGDSPYSSVACSSGNPYFIDLVSLKRRGLLTAEELKGAERKTLDYGALYEERYPTLRKAFARFNLDDEGFRAFVKCGQAEDYALFMTAKTVFSGSFCEWEEDLKFHREPALERLRTEYHEEYLFWQFLQYEFFTQWNCLKSYCNGLGVKFVGDIPLYVAYDSADVWAHANLFQLDEDLKPTKVAGVPPDYFSPTGQLWGNPIYNWKEQEKDGYAWWKKRLNDALSLYDVLRIDHFRGLDRYYEIEAGAEDARVGTWQDGPKAKLFEGISGEIIAEDLGVIDDGVRNLLKETGFPGMKVLLFAFDGSEDNPFLPKNIQENSVCYTGTHDNDTTVGYLNDLSAADFFLFRSRVAQAAEENGVNIRLKKGKKLVEGLVQLALSTKSRLAIVPIQDILGLDNGSRMNFPGTSEGNWMFRLNKQPSQRALKRFGNIIKKFER